MPDTATATVIGYDHISGEELFRVVDRPTTEGGRSALPAPGDTYIHQGRCYKVIEKRENAFDKMWTIAVCDEGPLEDPTFVAAQ
jgi:hypothetical protein